MGPLPRALYSAGWVLLPLRVFLGFTFSFAGLQKLANPGFFDASNPASIQAQLAGAARRSPVHVLVAPLAHVALPLGILIALAELAVGLGTLVGLWTRVAAAGGAFVSLMLFLTISFHSKPYYTGSDLVFVFAWTPLLLAGSGGVLCADAMLANRARRQIGAEASAVVPVSFTAVRRVCGFYEKGRCEGRSGAPCEPARCPYLLECPARARRLAEAEIDRRTFALKSAAVAALAVMGLLGAGAVAGLSRLAGGSSNKPAASPLRSGTGDGTNKSTALADTSNAGSHGGSKAPASPSAPTAGAGSVRPGGTRIGPARDVPIGGAASFQDPSTGDPSLVVQPRAGRFLAFDAVCPHAGCTVQYDMAAKLFICPCHGSEFNGTTGAVEIGPAATGLSHIGVSEGPDGQLYVT
ncbi:MAG: Rieske 2Fe-2S domain-containing protein [Acidimicrobiales bacterium]|jgi:thiosulfate dehydrogenase [quinone] large subunit